MIPIGDDPPPRHLFPFVTITLIAINVAVFIYELSLGSAIDTLFRSAGVIPLEFAVRQDLPPAAPLSSTTRLAAALRGSRCAASATKARSVPAPPSATPSKPCGDSRREASGVRR